MLFLTDKYDIYLEIFGYIGALLVILSMVMTSISKLRFLNILGSTISLIYSVICNTWPIVIMNGCLIIINIYQLIREKRINRLNNKSFNINKVRYIETNINNPIFVDFINQNKIDINNINNINIIMYNNEIIGFKYIIDNNNEYCKYLVNDYVIHQGKL